MSTEIFVIHIGQCGIQIGNAIWELFCVEHGIGPDGENFLKEDDILMKTFFQEVKDGKYCPRVIFLDSEPTVIEEIRSGVYKNLFHPDQLISGQEDAANNFARGSFYSGVSLLKKIKAQIRKILEQTNNLESFLILNSAGGGSGSGIGSLLLQQLALDFLKVTRIQIPLFSGPVMNTAIVEPYNTIFHVHTSVDTGDLAVLFDNEALYDICSKLLLIHSPQYNDLNRLLALMISSITCSLRYEATASTSLKEIRTNLIPYPRIHFPMVSHAPLDHKSRTIYSNYTADQITKMVFSKTHQSVKCDTLRGRYMAIILNYRGSLSTREVAEAVNKQKAKTSNFVEWCPTGYKININPQCPIIVPDSEVAFSNKGVTMICNTTAIRDVWVRLGRKFDLLFHKRAFIHWFIQEGMEEFEFGESRFNMKVLEEDYQEIGLNEKEMTVLDLKSHKTE